jgi:hypothetical protein
VVTKGKFSARAAPSATQAGARERAWTMATRSSRQSLASRRTLSIIESGFLVAAGNEAQTPPLACNSPTRRPPSVATSARAPTFAKPAAMSTAVRSAPPASSSGMI